MSHIIPPFYSHLSAAYALGCTHIRNMQLLLEAFEDG